jgi:hypothetical protein
MADPNPKPLPGPNPYAWISDAAHAVSQQDFLIVLEGADEFNKLKALRWEQAVTIGGMASMMAWVGGTVGFLAAGPVGAMLGAAAGGAAGAGGGAKVAHATRKDVTMWQLIQGLTDEQRAELWRQVKTQMAPVAAGVISAVVLRENSGLVLQIIGEFLAAPALAGAQQGKVLKQ